jgi:hypothetical protein
MASLPSGPGTTACLQLRDAIAGGIGGSSRPTPDEALVLRAACKASVLGRKESVCQGAAP